MFIRNEHGTSMLEYALLVGLLSLIAMTSVQVVGSQSEQAFSSVANAMSEPAGNPRGGGLGEAGGGDYCPGGPGMSC